MSLIEYMAYTPHILVNHYNIPKLWMLYPLYGTGKASGFIEWSNSQGSHRQQGSVTSKCELPLRSLREYLAPEGTVDLSHLISWVAVETCQQDRTQAMASYLQLEQSRATDCTLLGMQCKRLSGRPRVRIRSRLKTIVPMI